MVSVDELVSRMKHHYRFDRQEITGLIAAVIITAFIFTFRDWGDTTFSAVVGITNVFIVLVIAAVSFFLRVSAQKIYGLAQGHKARFKIWWTGLLIMLLMAFVSLGRLPLILIGAPFTTFMTRYRIGEFRYGYNLWANAMSAYWGTMTNMLLAFLFAVASTFFPQSYILTKGMNLNIIMALCSFIPLPQLDGLRIFMGSRGLYFTGLVLILLGTLLIVTKTTIGLTLVGVLIVIYWGGNFLIRSEK